MGNQYRFDLNGAAPCCFYDGKVDMFDKAAFQKLHETLTRQTDWTDACSWCKDQEDKGLRSPRNFSLESSMLGLNTADEPDELTSLEIQTDSDCNGACLICSPAHSTTWQKYANPKSIPIKEDDPASQRLERIKEIYDFSKLKKMGFANGGETLKSETHLKYLREIKKAGNLSNVMLIYTTNGSIRPNEETLELWHSAKQINLMISIDGIEDHFNYLRWPLQWHQVTANMKFLLDLPLPQLHMTFSYTATPFSLFYHDRYVAWAKEFFKDYSHRISTDGVFGFPSEARGIINLSCIPASLGREIIDKYRGTDMDRAANLVRPFMRTQYKPFMEYIELHDGKRGLNWRDVFPEIQHHFTDKLKGKT